MPLSSAVTTQLYTCAADLRSIRDEWTVLYRRAVGVTPFQSPAWLIPWYDVWGQNRTCVIAARDGDGEMLGIVPAVRTQTGLELGGSGVGDYLAPLLNESSVESAVEAFESALGGVACAFHDMPAAEIPWPRAHTQSWTATRGSARRAIPLPPSVDAFRESLPRGLRRNLKRYGTRLTRDASVEFRTVTDPVEVPQVLEALFELHAERWRERGGPGIFASAEVRDFHRRAAPALHHEGLLRLHCLIVDDTIAGIVYVIADRGRACSYIGGFDPALNRYSPGSLLLAYAIEHAISEGCHTYDLLRGGEAYKCTWGAVEQFTVSFCRPGHAGAV